MKSREEQALEMRKQYSPNPMTNKELQREHEKLVKEFQGNKEWEYQISIFPKGQPSKKVQVDYSFSLNGYTSPLSVFAELQTNKAHNFGYEFMDVDLNTITHNGHELKVEIKGFDVTKDLNKVRQIGHLNRQYMNNNKVSFLFLQASNDYKLFGNWVMFLADGIRVLPYDKSVDHQHAIELFRTWTGESEYILQDGLIERMKEIGSMVDSEPLTLLLDREGNVQWEFSPVEANLFAWDEAEMTRVFKEEQQRRRGEK